MRHLAAAIAPYNHHMAAVGLACKVACKTESIEDGNAVTLNGVTPGASHLTEHGQGEVAELGSDDAIVEQPVFGKPPLDVPAQLCGQRRRGLTRYVMSLMNGARVAISAQALGIAEAAYFEAKKYASEREQFKKSIDNFPAIYDMLSSMKMKILASRALLYETTRAVDLRNAYNALVEKGENVTDEIRAKQKYYNKVAAVLTPMCKAQATEVANSVAYDTIQIHGGTGYMKDFNAERFYRDARITNIYEGTTQLQIVAAIGGVQQRDNDPRIKELIALVPPAELAEIKASVVKMYEKHLKEVEFVNGLHDPEYRDLVARALVENETYVFVSLLMLRDAAKDDDRVVLAKRYILDAIPEFEKRYIRIMSGEHSVVADHSAVINY